MDGAAVPEHSHLNNTLSFLTKGSQVEVSSDEDGLNGAWFVATVIHPPPSISTNKSLHQNHYVPNNLVYVEYHNLLSEDSSPKRLREYANVSYVRPSPTDAAAPDFQLNDLVDAFYRDGWWTGLITRVVDPSNFVVTFQNPSEELQFNISDLRVHRKWVDGRWVQPQKQRTAGLMFSVGKKVEVSFEREDLHDVWFPATVLKNSGNGSFLVEYQQGGTNGEATLCKVTVDYFHIRPSPPHLRDKNFVLLEKVDAYYDFGWWCGVITKELADNRYVVFFKHTNKEREFIYSGIRPHMEWKGGKWFSTSQGGAEGRTTCSLTAEQIEQKTPSIDKQSSIATSTMKRTKQTSLDGNDKHSRPSKKLKDGIMSDDPSLSAMAHDVAPSKKTSGPPVGQSEGCGSEETIVNDQAFGKTENLSHGKKVRSKRGKGIDLNTPTTDSSKKKGRLATELRSSKALVEGATGDFVKEGSQENVEKEHDTKDLPLPVVIGLKCKEPTISRGKKLQQLSSERISDVAEGETQQPDVTLAPLAAVDKDGKGGDAEPVTPKRKRGRPPKLQAISPETSVAVNHQNEGVALAGVTMVEGCQKKEVGSPVSSGAEPRKEGQGPVKEQLKLTGKYNAPKQKNTSSDVMKIPPLSKDKLPNESSGQDLTAQRGTYSSVKGKRGKRRTISINTESPAQDSEDASKEKTDGRMEKDSTTRNPVASVEDDQPLSRWFEGKQSPTTVHGTAAALEGSAKLEIVMVPATGDAQNLPFMRSTLLWDTIESMEAFRKIPQKPHFRPLEGVKESAREGLAIASMVTFSTVVEKTCGLRFDDPRSAIEDCLETLVELESHGFDVEAIRDRLTGLLLIKDKQEELEEQSKGVGDNIEEQKAQGKRIDEEIGEIDKQIRELQERRGRAVLNKEKKISEIGGMKAAADGMEREMREVRLEFDGLAAAPW